jgi:hypothetical protein
MLVSVYRLAAVRPLEDMAIERMPPIEVARVRAVEEEHRLRQPLFRDRHEEVVVIRHQAIRMALPRELRLCEAEAAKEPQSIVVGEEERLPAVPSARDVKEAHSAPPYFANIRNLVTTSSQPSCSNRWLLTGCKR